ncbi:hypothetical protein D9611_013481 [Ephemerocybe angulata]|uniref:Uncharacterized protein n=1 Tax=Ephemerocybe angulata TaxID=980116 RepID=A0A8H5F9R3_9AGAR|nr:hypothetical protein D9611_013481 [Tulosesus angulatus]
MDSDDVQATPATVKSELEEPTGLGRLYFDASSLTVSEAKRFRDFAFPTAVATPGHNPQFKVDCLEEWVLEKAYRAFQAWDSRKVQEENEDIDPDTLGFAVLKEYRKFYIAAHFIDHPYFEQAQTSSNRTTTLIQAPMRLKPGLDAGFVYSDSTSAFASLDHEGAMDMSIDEAEISVPAVVSYADALDRPWDLNLQLETASAARDLEEPPSMFSASHEMGLEMGIADETTAVRRYWSPSYQPLPHQPFEGFDFFFGQDGI